MNNGDGSPGGKAVGQARPDSAAATPGGQLPQPIADKLQELILRIRRIVLLRGALIVAATAMGLILALMALDASIVLLPPSLQAALSACALLATAAVAWWVLYRPLSKRHTLTAIARVLEIRHPELEERISSAIDLAGSSDPTVVKGSELRIAELVKAAEADALAAKATPMDALAAEKRVLIPFTPAGTTSG